MAPKAVSTPPKYWFWTEYESDADTNEDIRRYYSEWVPEFDLPGGIGEKVRRQRKWLCWGDFSLLPITRWKDTAL